MLVDNQADDGSHDASSQFAPKASAEIDRHRGLSARARRIVLGQPGRQTIWREWGDGKPFILLHGNYGSWTHWTRNIAALAASRRVLVPDTPGFGELDLPEVPDAGTIVESLWKDIDRLAGTEAVVDLAGFSYGGGLAGGLAACRPHRVGRTILVGSGGLGAPGGYREELVRWRDLDAAGQREAHRRNLRILMFASPETVDDLALSLQAANAAGAKMNARKLRNRMDLRQVLVGKKVVLSGIWGERDFTLAGLPLASREQAVRSLDTDAEWIALPDVGHWAQYEAAHAVNKALLRILDTPRTWRAPTEVADD